ncbi:hypothetical protein EDD22DRAFT_161434 [Suillus occidentalis]|nr:hypothetical protein EDD22DRAFT_399790 [Suillus occidentalis]KAG1758979.1 hypothetical protein EDD22DRAFT_161434 [Suillus occidentalis]
MIPHSFFFSALIPIYASLDVVGPPTHFPISYIGVFFGLVSCIFGSFGLRTFSNRSRSNDGLVLSFSSAFLGSRDRSSWSGSAHNLNIHMVRFVSK